MITQEKEKTVKQSGVFQSSFLNLMSTYQWSNQQIKVLLTPYEITYHQLNVLRILKEQYPSNSTLNLIKSKIVDQMSDVSRTIDRLLFKGYVEKSTNTYDKRAVALVITDKGLSMLKKVDREVDFSTLFSAQLTHGEAVQLDTLLLKVRGVTVSTSGLGNYNDEL